jgi:lysophospholipase L1-like esterase
MACGNSATKRSGARAITRAAGLAFALALALALPGGALAQTSTQDNKQDTKPESYSPALSQSCQQGAAALASETPLPRVAAALARGKTLRILTIGAGHSRSGAHGGGYGEQIETMLERALKSTDVVMINRGVSGELAADAANRMRNEVALTRPDLVLWQVGTNDALTYVQPEEFAATLTDQIAWLKAHKVDVVLVGLQFANQVRRDAHYALIRDTLRKVAAQENVPVVRFYEAMQIINASSANAPNLDDFERTDAGYDCLAQYVARAITLGVFAKNIPAPRRQ